MAVWATNVHSEQYCHSNNFAYLQDSFLQHSRSCWYKVLPPRLEHGLTIIVFFETQKVKTIYEEIWKVETIFSKEDNDTGSVLLTTDFK